MNTSAIWLKASVIGSAVATVAACSSAPSPSSSSSAAPSPSAQSPATASSTSAEAGTIIDVAIANGAVTPTNAEVQAVAGQPVVLQVSSDAADSLHVHSVPEHVFDIAAGPGQRFEFTVDIPGRVAVELHDLHVTVVTIEVRP
jgi:heme/copper-type cytochrome/quinol oxidase subunit 2